MTGIFTLASGLFLLRTLVVVQHHTRISRLFDYSPFAFRHLSRFLTLVLGFALTVTSVYLLRRKRRAFWAAVILSGMSIVLHLVRRPDLLHSVLSAVLLCLLIIGRKSYTVGSGLPAWRPALMPVAVGLAFALVYGIAGFWWLDERAFGLNFNLLDSARHALGFLSLVGDPQMIPLTYHARWFADSLHLMTMLLLGWTVLQLYRPVAYRFHIQPRERHLATSIVQTHGRCAVDFFKYWHDKSFFFSASGRSVISYRVAGSFAVALGDPVGPEEEIGGTVSEFLRFCEGNDWGVAFHQAMPDFLPIYRGLGLKRLKIGDEAIVDLPTFSMDGKPRKGIRHTVHVLEAAGTRTFLAEPPVDQSLLARARQVSDAWLTIPGRRERGFTLGWFDETYLRGTSLFAMEDAKGRLLAFTNLIPSFHPGESTIDLMRHLPDAPNGTMDCLFVKLFELLRDRGFTRFNLGMAPMSGFDVREEASAEERAVHLLLQQLNFLFSFRGLKAYKAKFAGSWEPRYAIYRHPLDLARLAIALGRVSTVAGDAT